jgi:hypothetical protein
MRNKSDTYIAIYNKYREEREQEIIDLKNELRQVKRLVEFLAKKVFE